MRWTDVEDIAQALEEEYPDEDVQSLTLEEIREMVASISDFEDYETEVKENLLEEIKEIWLSLR